MNNLNNKKLGSVEEALTFYNKMSLQELMDLADSLREKTFDDKFTFCSIINAKSGSCSEDCNFCSQSISANSEIKKYNFLNEKIIIDDAKNNQMNGIKRYSLVTSGKGISNKDLKTSENIFKKLSKELKLELCASHGIISYEQALTLKNAGVTNYHHNLESGPNYFHKICTTHKFEDRITTIKNAKKAGLRVCSGGIIGLGETIKDRIEMAFELDKLNIDSVPINILNAIEGTKIYKSSVDLSNDEILKSIAMFRIILPYARIIIAGGRQKLEENQHLIFKAGVNSAITGDYLTTTGNTIESDKKMVENLGFIINKS